MTPLRIVKRAYLQAKTSWRSGRMKGAGEHDDARLLADCERIKPEISFVHASQDVKISWIPIGIPATPPQFSQTQHFSRCLYVYTTAVLATESFCAGSRYFRPSGFREIGSFKGVQRPLVDQISGWTFARTDNLHWSLSRRHSDIVTPYLDDRKTFNPPHIWLEAPCKDADATGGSMAKKSTSGLKPRCVDKTLIKFSLPFSAGASLRINIQDSSIDSQVGQERGGHDGQSSIS
jgi:hypothetical protein